MANRMKRLTLASVAIAVMSATVSSPAQAGSLDVGVNPTVITATNFIGQQHVLTVPRKTGEFSAQCPNASFEGTVQGAQTDITEATLTPTFGPECKLNGLAAAIRMNGCKYTVSGSGQAALTALVDIIGCTSGKKMEFELIATGCILTIGEQNNISHLVFQQTNSESPVKDADISLTLASIAVVQGSKCPEPGITSIASLTGNTVVRAFVDAGTAQVTFHNHQYVEHKCGAQADLVVT